MTRGHLDSELERMSRIVDRLAPGALILLDESFASTNEHEATGPAETSAALIASGHQVCYVTHMYELARRFYDARVGHFLRAQRRDDESLTVRLVESGPIETSYGRICTDVCSAKNCPVSRRTATPHPPDGTSRPHQLSYPQVGVVRGRCDRPRPTSMPSYPHGEQQRACAESAGADRSAR